MSLIKQSNTHQLEILPPRVPGLSEAIRLGNCPRRFTNWVLRRPKLSAIGMIAKTIFERLVLVSGWCSLEKFVTMPSTPHTHRVLQQLFLDFCLFWQGPGPLDSRPNGPGFLLCVVKYKVERFFLQRTFRTLPQGIITNCPDRSNLQGRSHLGLTKSKSKAKAGQSYSMNLTVGLTN